MSPSSAVIFTRSVSKIQLVGLISYAHRASYMIAYLEPFLTVNATVQIHASVPSRKTPILSRNTSNTLAVPFLPCRPSLQNAIKLAILVLLFHNGTASSQTSRPSHCLSGRHRLHYPKTP
ncbi:hypothetical protein FOQG_19480 [Fusarium oxysporum f. sp. raphani 54005]|uniref:Uncharacterized protein n=1 Tax=Fusarium oxysporum f. sp. raphani 54005 TaxID=1089458 RepID=X0B0Y1_FUSOX|nr:hypothetical protein FOQG_19480 [Fusarium oxysporum f. sp. raphani 54005]